MTDQSMNKRLFVGGLAAEITPEMLKKKFKSFGIVEKIDIHRKKSLTDDSTNVFAFLNLNASQQNLNKCIQAFNNSTWDGKVMRIQIARESFMDRLAAERKQNNAIDKIDVNVNKNSIVKEWSQHDNVTNVNAMIQKNLEGVRVVKNNKMNIQIKRKNGYPSSSDDSDDDDDEEEKTVSLNKDDDDDNDSTSDDSSSSDEEEIKISDSNSLKKTSSSKPPLQSETLKTKKRKVNDEEEDTDDDDKQNGKKAKKLKTDFEDKAKIKTKKSREEDDAEEKIMKAEKKRSMEILNSIVKMRPEKRKMSSLSENEVRRFDPTKPGHTDLVVSQTSKIDEKSDDDSDSSSSDDNDQSSEPKIKKPKIIREKKEELKEVKDSPQEDGGKRYAEVSSSVIGAFKQSETFKLSSLFGNDDDDDDDEENCGDARGNNLAAPAAKKPKLVMNNIFGWDEDNNEEDEEYDDYDDDRDYEDEDHDNSIDVKTSGKMGKKTKETELTKNKKTSQKKIKKFFFDDSDPRLAEGGNFYRTEDLEELRKKWEENRSYYVESYRLRKRRYRALR